MLVVVVVVVGVVTCVFLIMFFLFVILFVCLSVGMGPRSLLLARGLCCALPFLYIILSLFNL